MIDYDVEYEHPSAQHSQFASGRKGRLSGVTDYLLRLTGCIDAPSWIPSGATLSSWRSDEWSVEDDFFQDMAYDDQEAFVSQLDVVRCGPGRVARSIDDDVPELSTWSDLRITYHYER